MNNRNLDPMNSTQRGSILAQIREGMHIHDRDDHHIGSVDFVHFGAASEMQQELGTGPASPGPADSPQMREGTFVDMIAEAFQPNEVPQELQEKLLTNGYIRMDASGFFAADRFITSDQIASVANDRVHLTATRDELIKRR